MIDISFEDVGFSTELLLYLDVLADQGRVLILLRPRVGSIPSVLCTFPRCLIKGFLEIVDFMLFLDSYNIVWYQGIMFMCSLINGHS